MSLLPIVATIPTVTMALIGLGTLVADRGIVLDERRRNRRRGRDGRRGGRRATDLVAA